MAHAAWIRLLTEIETGDIAGFERSLGEMQAAADAAGSMSLKAAAAGCVVLRALLDGRVSDVEALATSALELAPHNFGGQIFELVRLQGRTAQAVPVLDQLMDAHPRLHIVGRAAVAYAEVGRTAEAATLLERLGSDDFKAVAVDAEQTAVLAWLAETAARVQDPIAAADLLELLDRSTTAGYVGVESVAASAGVGTAATAPNSASTTTTTNDRTRTTEPLRRLPTHPASG